MQEIIDRLLESERFSMNSLYSDAWHNFAAIDVISDNLKILNESLSKSKYKKIACGILRHAFLIELVKFPGIETSKFRSRWYSQLTRDQRECHFEDCLEIAQDLVIQLTNEWLNDPQKIEILNLFLDNSILPYELPIDYSERPAIDDTNAKIHRRGNIAWTIDKNIVKTLKLRQYIINPETSPDADLFKKVINDKIKIKTYLTDRVLTGVHKTNREKRWEVHPHSVHFAFRRVCMAIEYELIVQLCGFQGFPETFREMLQNQGILPEYTEISRCPITLEPLIFDDFKDELINPTHGKSNFQVGHLNPLKLDNYESAASGHTPANISWISADGNRIQGSKSLGETRSMLKRITHNYENEELI